MDFDFLIDTGASTMRIYEEEREKLGRLSNTPLPSLRQVMIRTPMGSIMVPIVIVQAMISQSITELLPRWVDIKACVLGRRDVGNRCHLSGVWMHHLLFFSSIPDHTRKIHVGTDIGEMVAGLPIPDYKKAIAPSPLA